MIKGRYAYLVREDYEREAQHGQALARASNKGNPYFMILNSVVHNEAKAARTQQEKQDKPTSHMD